MRIQHYTHEAISHRTHADLPSHLASQDGAVWVDITLPSEEGIAVLRDTFRFHELAIEDVLNQEQRPKAEEFSDYVFMILNPLFYNNGEIKSRELDVFFGQGYLVTVHVGEEPIVEQAQRRIMPGKVSFDISATYLLYVLLDTVVDEYLPLLEQIEGEIDVLGTQLLSRPNRQMQLHLFKIKRNLNTLWWIIWPQKDILSVVTHHNLEFVDKKSQYYLRDVADHLTRITDTLQASRESVTGLINLYVSAVSNQLNMAVNRLTVFAVLIGVLTVVGGFYGMNFQHTWPPFDAPWGVPFVIGVMILLSVVTYLLVRRRNGSFPR